MKKLLMLILVLGIASTANALVVSISPDGTGTSTTLTISSDTFNVGYDYFLVVSDNTNGDISAITATADAGGDSVVTSYGAAAGYDDAWQVKAQDLNAATPHADDIEIGTHFNVTINYTGGGSALLIELVNGNLTQLDTYTVTPEPMTIALLGLGGLFLRRRKK